MLMEKTSKNIINKNLCSRQLFQNKENASIHSRIVRNSNYLSYLDDHNEDNAKDDGDNNDARH